MSSAQTQQGVALGDDAATSTTSTSSGRNKKKKRGGAGTDGNITPPPLPQGEVDTGLSPGTYTRSMEEDNNDNAGMISAESSSSDAVLATAPVHAAKPIIPGPFVVFQGIPGDGLGNTIDSCPMLQYHSSSSRTGSRIGSRAGSLRLLLKAVQDLTDTATHSLIIRGMGTLLYCRHCPSLMTMVSLFLVILLVIWLLVRLLQQLKWYRLILPRFNQSPMSLPMMNAA
mmetsp:Transcript_4833/g.10256  ORF Transcript_4833/g.10256 Transcript_4833/m.10256 type:complete len:227 (+) Transcript_4833:570-1250(+)